jgi:hypothetical protein
MSRCRVSGRRLTVERDATVTAVIPPGVGDDTLAKPITTKQPWLYAKLRERAEIGVLGPPPRVRVRQGIPLSRA